MHITIVIIIILITWKCGDWKDWQKYHTTMLVAIAGNLLYNLIYCDHILWKFKPDFFNSFLGVEMLYTFIVFPLTVLLFLTNYPISIKAQIFKIIKYIAIYVIVEYIYFKHGRIVYNYGWNLGWSVAWNFFMFPIWALHHKKPLVAYGVSILFVIVVLLLFPVEFP